MSLVLCSKPILVRRNAGEFLKELSKMTGSAKPGFPGNYFDRQAGGGKKGLRMLQS